jgi:hypothetical protein
MHTFGHIIVRTPLRALLRNGLSLASPAIDCIRNQEILGKATAKILGPPMSNFTETQKSTHLNISSEGFKCSPLILHQCFNPSFFDNQRQYYHLHKLDNPRLRIHIL